VRVVHHQQNQKLGGALKSGIAAARADLILYTDADLPCDIAELRKALRFLRLYQADVVSAFRMCRTGEGALRAIYSFGYNWLVRALFGLRVRDVNFAFKLFRRRVVERVALRSQGSFIDAELLAKAQRRGCRIVQFGVDYVPRLRGVSTLSRPSVILRILLEMASLWPEIRRLKPPPTPAPPRAAPHLLSSTGSTRE
jgi:glycosyltransferase involved in cell wall biosynthesis